MGTNKFRIASYCEGQGWYWMWLTTFSLDKAKRIVKKLVNNDKLDSISTGFNISNQYKILSEDSELPDYKEKLDAVKRTLGSFGSC